MPNGGSSTHEEHQGDVDKGKDDPAAQTGTDPKAPDPHSPYPTGPA